MISAARPGLPILAAGLLCSVATPAVATVAREDIVILAADGHHYTSYKTLRSELAQRVVYLAPGVSADDASFIVPGNYRHKRLADGRTRLRLPGGSYAIMKPAVFSPDQLEKADNGDLIYHSATGDKSADGHFGKWNTPGKFDSFVYSWVVPANIRIVTYRANRDGRWSRRGHTLNWHARQVNDIAFTIRYRVEKPTTGRRAKGTGNPGHADAAAQPPRPDSKPAVKRTAAASPEQPDRRGRSLRIAPTLGLQAPPEKSSHAQAPEPAPQPARGAKANAKPQSRIQPEIARSENALALAHMVVLANGRPVITGRGKAVLNRLAQTLRQGGAERVVVRGPDVADPRDLGGSAARAARVADYLKKRGVDRDIVKTRYGGAGNKGQRNPDTVTIAVTPAHIIRGFAARR